jgi:hypothetical protein
MLFLKKKLSMRIQYGLSSLLRVVTLRVPFHKPGYPPGSNNSFEDSLRQDYKMPSDLISRQIQERVRGA